MSMIARRTIRDSDGYSVFRVPYWDNRVDDDDDDVDDDVAVVDWLWVAL